MKLNNSLTFSASPPTHEKTSLFRNGIGLTQTIGGVLMAAGGAALTVGSSGIALAGGIMAITWGTKEAMDGVGKMVNAIFDDEYSGMLPIAAGAIAKNR
jgi:hypothetical protein